MIYLQEVTVWSVNTPNHIYYMNDSKSHAVGYIKAGTTSLFKFSKPISIDIRGRKFVALDRKAERDEVYFPKKRTEQATTSTMETRTVEGSGGRSYTLTKMAGSWICNCPGYTFRRRCKHTESAK